MQNINVLLIVKTKIRFSHCVHHWYILYLMTLLFTKIGIFFFKLDFLKKILDYLLPTVTPDSFLKYACDLIKRILQSAQSDFNCFAVQRKILSLKNEISYLLCQRLCKAAIRGLVINRWFCIYSFEEWKVLLQGTGARRHLYQEKMVRKLKAIQ